MGSIHSQYRCSSESRSLRFNSSLAPTLDDENGVLPARALVCDERLQLGAVRDPQLLRRDDALARVERLQVVAQVDHVVLQVAQRVLADLHALQGCDLMREENELVLEGDRGVFFSHVEIPAVEEITGIGQNLVYFSTLTVSSWLSFLS